MEIDDSERDRAPEQDERRRPMDERVWLATSGKLLDERAFLEALGRGGAHRMAIPLERA
jgi:hypothetical protein